LLDAKFGLPPVKAHLHKSIPTGAGLGGGSSDAGFFINLLDEKFELGISTDEKIKLASQLGSDCAFFIENKPVLASGKGDIFDSININLDSYFFVVVYPAIHSNTAEAYKGIVPAKPKYDLTETMAGGISAWKERLVNDFEKNIFFRFPELENIKAKFYDSGALYAAMSGSGSAVFGIFEKEMDAAEFNFPPDYLVYAGAFS